MVKKSRKVTSKPVNPAQNSPMRLTDLEAARMEFHQALASGRQEATKVLALENRRIEDQERILNLMLKNLEIDRLKLQNAKNEFNANTAEQEKGYEKFLGTIRERLGIKGHFGFDPQTLEVSPD